MFLKSIVPAALCIALASCQTVTTAPATHARIHNLATGEIIAAVAQTGPMGRIIITAGPTMSGETLTGEATDLKVPAQASPYASTTAFTPSAYTDTYLSASRDRNATPGYVNKRAILTGTRGTVIDVSYRIGPSGIGDGDGSDNQGVRYRLEFSPQ